MDALSPPKYIKFLFLKLLKIASKIYNISNIKFLLLKLLLNSIRFLSCLGALEALYLED